MKKIVLVFISLFFVTNTFGQMGITEHLDTLKYKYPNGSVETDTNCINFYVVESTYLDSYLVFTLDEYSYCVFSAVKPYNYDSYKEWIKTLNREWKKDNSKSWSFTRSDGLNFVCKLDKDYCGDKIFLFYTKD